MPVLSVTAPFISRIETPRFLDVFARVGCRSCQYFRDHTTTTDTATAKEVVERAGLVFDSMHGRFGEDLDPSTPDSQLRAETIREYEQEGEIAAALEAPLVVVHPSWRAAAQPNDAGRAGAADIDSRRLESLLRSLEDLATVGEELGVLYLIENLPPTHWIGSDAPLLAEWIRRADSPALRMCFDLGHAHMTAAELGPVGEQLARCIDVVGYVHVHDNDGASDSHRLPGEGTIDWPGVAAALTEAPPDLILMLETFHDPIEKFEREAQRGLGERISTLLGLR